MIDTHCHLNDVQFDGIVDQIVNNYQLAGVEKVICVGCDNLSNEKAKQISNNYDSVYYAVGIHPDDCESFDSSKLEQYLKSKDRKLVAVGEIGLDYFHNKNNKQKQINTFSSQIDLANKYHLPVIIHCREAYGDCLDVLKSNPPQYGFVFHCFSGSLEFAKIVISMGGKISFTGSVSFNNAHNLHEVAKNIPLDSFFFETDSPYLSPVPVRGTRNESKNVNYVAKFVSTLRNQDFDTLVKATDYNATQFFGL